MPLQPPHTLLKRLTLPLLLLLVGSLGCINQVLAQKELPQQRVGRLKDSIDIVRAIEESVKISKHYPDSANRLLTHIYNASKALDFTFGMGMAAYQQGIVYTNIHKLSEAKANFETAITHLNQTDKGKAALYKPYSNLGNIAFLNGNYEEALQLQLKALAIGERYTKENIDHLYSNVATVLMQLGRSTQSVRSYLQKAETAAAQNKNYDVLSKVYNNTGLSLSLEQKWDSSVVYFRKALMVAQQHQLPTMVHLALGNIGIINLEQTKLDSALVYLEQSYAMDSVATGFARSRTRGALGVVYLKLGKFMLAKPLLLAQYDSALSNNNKHDLRDAYYNLSQLYGAEGNFKLGYQYAWNYIHTNDSIAGREIIHNVNELEIKHKTAEKEKQILAHQLRLAQQEERIQRKSKWLFLALGIALLLFAIIIVLKVTQLAKRKLMKEELKLISSNREIENLNARINGEEQERTRIAKDLHDGLGALVSAAKINLMSLSQSDQETNKDAQENTLELLEEIGVELRRTAHNMMPTAITDHNLKEALYSFCVHASKGKNLKIEFQAYGALDQLTEDYQLTVYRIIQELINNIVKHAQANNALVQLVYQDALLSITVEDNGKGFVWDETAPVGIGIQSIKDRVKSKGGTLSLSSTIDKGTSVYIEFEVNSQTQPVLG